MAVTTDIVKRAGDNWEAQLAAYDENDQTAIKAMAQATIAAGVYARETPQALIYAAASLAHSLGLKAELGHVMIYTTRGQQGGSARPYVTEEGYEAWASQFDQYDGAEWCVLNQDEKDDLLISQPLAIKVTGYRKDWRVPAVAIGYADPTVRDQAVEKRDPFAMAMARGHRRMLRRLFPMSAGRVAELEAKAMRGLGFTMDQVHSAALEDAGNAPASTATDEWRSFWIEVSRDPNWHDQSRQDIHDVIAKRLSVDLPTTDPDTDGVVETTFKGSGITPKDAWAALHRDRQPDAALTHFDPESARTPEERVFGNKPTADAEKPQDEASSPTDAADETTFAAWQTQIESATLKRLASIRVKIVVDHENGKLDDDERDALESLIDEKSSFERPKS